MENPLLLRAAGQSTCPSSDLLANYLEESAARHHHLCPRQVLGIRMGLYGLLLMGLTDAQYEPRYTNERKHLLTIVETDGCGADGVAVATGCYVGRRTLRVVDFGKMAATLVHTQNDKAVRIFPRLEARRLARAYAPDARSRWHAYLRAYQIIPDELLLSAKEVALTQSIAEILSRPSARVNCESCGEEILNEREVRENGRLLCRSCAGATYYCELKPDRS
jgi:formylmethanofuran dehydrogenase subunit E